MHRHREAYAALIVAGTYTESSVDGPVPCRPGTLVLHPAFHAHADRFGSRDVRVMNVTLPATWGGSGAQVLSVPTLQEAIQVVRHAPERLDELCLASSPHEVNDVRDWHRPFLEALRNTDEPVGRIARRLGISAAHASRDLRNAFGMPPQALRRELRWRRALELLGSPVPLRDVAAISGFADQSHLTRVVRARTGVTPAALRKHIKSVQDSAAAASVE
ncbi:MAG: AraC family transcriptional regulator [Gammaproteobacteria bacterium]|nr:AraC family transcriptional regulator [Gammaproteobacteria bacterium]